MNLLHVSPVLNTDPQPLNGLAGAETVLSHQVSFIEKCFLKPASLVAMIQVALIWFHIQTDNKHCNGQLFLLPRLLQIFTLFYPSNTAIMSDQQSLEIPTTHPQWCIDTQPYIYMKDEQSHHSSSEHWGKVRAWQRASSSSGQTPPLPYLSRR